MDKFQLWILEAHVKQGVSTSRSDRDLIRIWWQEASCGRCVIVCVEMAMFFSSFCPAPGLEERDFLPGNRPLGVEPRSPGAQALLSQEGHHVPQEMTAFGTCAL